MKHERCVGHAGLQISGFLNWTEERLIWGFSAITEARLNTELLPHCSNTLGNFETRGSSNESWLPGGVIETWFEGNPASSKEQKAGEQSCLLQVESTVTGSDHC